MRKLTGKLRQSMIGIAWVTILSLQPGALAAENAFSGSGPFGGRVSKVQFDPADANRAYALGFRNGIFFSDDAGVTWERFEVDHPSIFRPGISDFALDPNAPSTMWVVDAGGEVARTTDRGATWTISTAGLLGGLTTLTVDHTNSGIMFVDNSTTFFRSADGGDTWSAVATGPGDSPRSSIIQSQSDPLVYMALGWEGPYKSTDSGQTWTLMADNLPLTDNGYVFATHGVFDPTNSDAVLINVANEENWRTLDGGATWAPYGTGVPNDFFTTMIRDPSDNTRIFMGTGNNDLFVSNDNGLTWGAADLSGLGQYTVADIEFDPSDATRMLIGTSTKGLFVSADSGANWTLSTEGFVNIGVDAIAFDADDGRIYLGTPGGTAESGDDGQTWTANVGSYDIWTFSVEADPLVPNHAYAGSGCCGLYESFDAGQNWTRIDLELPSVVATWVTDIDIPASNSNQILFSDFNRGLFGTTDAGNTWAQISTGLEPFFTNNVSLEAVDASETNNTVVYAVSSNFQSGGVFRSIDFGATWERKSGDGISGPSRSYAVAVHPQNPNIVFVGTSGVQKSIDGGDTWTQPATNVPHLVFSIEINHENPQLMYAVSENHGLYRSVDGGTNWAAAPNDGVTQRTNHMTVDPNDRGRVLVGYDDIGYQEVTYSTDTALTDNTGPLSGAVNDVLSVSMTVTANGPIDANWVEVRSMVPEQFAIDSAAVDTGSCTVDGQSVSCVAGTLADSASATVSLSLTALTDGDYDLVATVNSLESDPVQANNTVTVPVLIGALLDTDNDGVADSVDNCTTVVNANQVDIDGDGYGNACDADFNNDCVVNFLDLAAFSGQFLSSNPLFDINSDGAVNFLDFVSVSQGFLQPPGPGLGSCL